MEASSSEVKLTLIGGPTVLIEIAGLRLITDPTFDPPQKYESSGITLEKTTPPAITAENVGRVDAVLLSHDQHFDNFDHTGRTFQARAENTFTTPVAAARLGGSAVGLAPGQTAILNSASSQSLHITATPARHGPPGIEAKSGDVTGFALGLQNPGDAIYIAGDTVWFDVLAKLSAQIQPRVVIAFTGAAKARGPFRLTMDSNDALEAARYFPAAKIVCVHNEGWTHFTETQRDVEQAFAYFGLTSRFQPLRRGEIIRILL